MEQSPRDGHGAAQAHHRKQPQGQSGHAEALEYVKRDDLSPKQVARYMKSESRLMSHRLTCRYVRADGSGELAGHYRHGMKYGRHGRPDRTIKAGNVSVKELYGKVFVDRGYIRRESSRNFYGSRQL